MHDADRALEVGHPVVEPEDIEVGKEPGLQAQVADLLGNAGAMVPQAFHAGIDPAVVVVTIPPSPVVITLRGWKEKTPTFPSPPAGGPW